MCVVHGDHDPLQPWQGCRSAIIHEHKSDPTLTLTLLERASQFQQRPHSSSHTGGHGSACLERPCFRVPQASGGVVYAESAGSSSIYIRVEQSSFTGNFVSGIRVRARTDSVAPMALGQVCLVAVPPAINRSCPRDAAVERVAAVSFANPYDPCPCPVHSSAQQSTITLRHPAQR